MKRWLFILLFLLVDKTYALDDRPLIFSVVQPTPASLDEIASNISGRRVVRVDLKALLRQALREGELQSSDFVPDRMGIIHFPLIKLMNLPKKQNYKFRRMLGDAIDSTLFDRMAYVFTLDQSLIEDPAMRSLLPVFFGWLEVLFHFRADISANISDELRKLVMPEGVVIFTFPNQDVLERIMNLDGATTIYKSILMHFPPTQTPDVVAQKINAQINSRSCGGALSSQEQ